MLAVFFVIATLWLQLCFVTAVNPLARGFHDSLRTAKGIE
jgi:hypothetical protein